MILKIFLIRLIYIHEFHNLICEYNSVWFIGIIKYRMQKLYYSVNIIRTNRKKTVSIYISRNSVKLVVPKEINEKEINYILDSKKSWIISKLKKKDLTSPKQPKKYVSGELFPYLGRKYPLEVINGKENSINLKRGCLNIFISENEKKCNQLAKKILLEWYFARAKKLLTQKTYKFCERIGVKPKTIIIKDYKSKWGSCSIKGDIRYNWRIIMAPIKVIDYLVIHELCHLLEHNHSQSFWSHVSIFCPNMKESRKWLKKFGSDLIEL